MRGRNRTIFGATSSVQRTESLLPNKRLVRHCVQNTLQSSWHHGLAKDASGHIDTCNDSVAPAEYLSLGIFAFMSWKNVAFAIETPIKQKIK